ncbi:MAG: ATP-binding protein, partial [Deltaproteobacteria bacterium]|nr:ATP-binding protein [Deltaproteobacteria bacterium]
MSASQPKEFNTTGPCDPLDHYMLPALPRLPEVQDLVNSEEYFVLHAPRQSGKTTSIYAAVDQINAEEKYY